MVGASIMVHRLGLRANVPRLQCAPLAIVTVTCHNFRFCFIPIDDMHLLPACSATANWAVFPNASALLCSFRQCSSVLPVWPMYTFEQVPHGIR